MFFLKYFFSISVVHQKEFGCLLQYHDPLKIIYKDTFYVPHHPAP